MGEGAVCFYLYITASFLGRRSYFHFVLVVLDTKYPFYWYTEMEHRSKLYVLKYIQTQTADIHFCNI